MDITVFGSTGRTGRHILALAHDRGHRLTAFTRRPEALPDSPAPARVVAGDGRDPEAVADAVTGADAVIAIVTASTRRGPHQAAEVAARVTEAMAAAGVRRLVLTSAYPLVAVRPRLPVMVLRRALADAYADLRRMERVVAASGLDWTVVRLNRLVDKPARGATVVSPDLLAKASPVTRADAAATLLDLAEDGAHLGSAVNVSGRRPRSD